MPPLNPTVIAYHLVWTAYGTWLPNDPRGSDSRRVAGPLLAELGQLHFGRKKTQPSRDTLRSFYQRAESRLAFPIIRFNAKQIDQIAAAFSDAIREHAYTCYGCAIMPDHVHIVIRKHRHRAEAMIDNLQAASRLRLSNAREIPSNHPIWTQGGWKRFLDTPTAVQNVNNYVETNPPKSGLSPQSWPFVAPYDNWPHRARPAQ